MILITCMIEVQFSGTTLLLQVNPRILHQYNGTACSTYVIVRKEDASLPAMFNPLYTAL